jgi:hypothetical protein
MHPAKTMIASVAAVALLASSTAAVAAVPPPQAPAAQVQPQAPDAWMMLSVLSPTRAVALGGANAAAQPNPPPPPGPPPPPEAAGGLGEGWAPVAVVGLWAILIVIALATKGNNGNPNSPP